MFNLKNELMKRILLFVVIALFTYGAQAQETQKMNLNANFGIADYDVRTNSEVPAPFRGGDESSIIAIGASGNIYGVMLGSPTQVWYNQDINSVVFIHRQVENTSMVAS